MAAFVTGQAVPWLAGYDVATTEAPWWVMILAVVAAIAVILVPLAFTALWSRRARAAGEPQARAPLVVGLVIVVGLAGVLLFSAVAQLLFE